MKKDLIFAPIMLLIGVLLFLLRVTGIVIMNVHGIVALAVIHNMLYRV